MSKHSPAPWTFSAVSEQVLSADGETVVWEAGTNEADNYLIAAAPELLSSLKAILAECQGYVPNTTKRAWATAYAVVAKATGETE